MVPQPRALALLPQLQPNDISLYESLAIVLFEALLLLLLLISCFSYQAYLEFFTSVHNIKPLLEALKTYPLVNFQMVDHSVSAIINII